jgi:hypothetical protein
MMKELFPCAEIHMNYKHPDLTYNITNARMELDIFVPSLGLAIEYNGTQHYNWHFLFGSPDDQITRDSEKRHACRSIGITLVEIPFWWDLKLTTLAATIHKHRPGSCASFAITLDQKSL